MQLSSGRGWRGIGNWKLAERGFTVGELLMVASLLTFAGTGVKALVSHARKGQRGTEVLALQELFSKGRGAVDRMVQELGQAGTPTRAGYAYDPEITAANSNRVAASRFLVATPTHLIFEADVDHDGTVERVEYRLNGNTLERRAISKLPDGTAPEAQYEALIGNVDNGDMPLFSYAGDPFGAAETPSVRILLLLRAPALKHDKAAYRTLGFEGVARPQNSVVAQQNPTLEQSKVEDVPLQSDLASGEWPVQDRYVQKWTMR